MALAALLLPLSLSVARAESVAPRFRVAHKTVATSRKLGFARKTWEELSEYLYGGDASYAHRLKELNHSSALVPKKVRYLKPFYRLARGDTLQLIGGLLLDGSAKSYFSLLKLNPKIHDPDRLKIGTWIALPRIPSPFERAGLQQRFVERNGEPRGHSPLLAKLAPPDRPPVAAAEEVAPAAAVAAAPAEATAATEESAASAAAPETAKMPAAALAEPSRSAAAIPPSSCAPSPYEPRTLAERMDLARWYLDRVDPKSDRERGDVFASDLVRGAPNDWSVQYLAGQYYLKTARPSEARTRFHEALRSETAPIQVALFYVRASAKENKPVPDPELQQLIVRYPALASLLSVENKTE